MKSFGDFTIDGLTISGTAKKVTEFTNFSSNQDEREGYYLPVNIEPWEGAEVRSGRTPETWKPLKDDGIVVIYLGKEAPDQTPWYEVKDVAGTITRYNINVTAAAVVRTKQKVSAKQKQTAKEADTEAEQEAAAEPKQEAESKEQ